MVECRKLKIFFYRVRSHRYKKKNGKENISIRSPLIVLGMLKFLNMLLSDFTMQINMTLLCIQKRNYDRFYVTFLTKD